MQLVIQTQNGPQQVSAEQVDELLKAGTLDENLCCLSTDGGQTWESYKQLVSRLRTAGPNAAANRMATQSAQPGAGYPCPECFQDIPGELMCCPYCGASLADCVPDQAVYAMLQKSLARLKDVEDDPAFVAERQAKMGGLSTRSVVGLAGVVVFAFLIYMASQAPRHSRTGYMIFTILFETGFAIYTLATLSFDMTVKFFSSSWTGKKAFRRFFTALRFRPLKAYYALAPEARERTLLPPIRFEKIPMRQNQPGGYASPDDFRAYWRAFFKGPSGHQYTVQLKRVDVINYGDDVCLAEGQVALMSYSSWLLLTILGGLAGIIIGAILTAAMAKRETIFFRKLLIRRNGRWYVLDGMFNSPIDSQRGLLMLQNLLKQG